jgi:hypothetical protein
MEHLNYNINSKKTQALFEKSRKLVTNFEYNKAKVRSKKMNSFMEIEGIIPNLMNTIMDKDFFATWMQKNLEIIIQQVFNIEFCLMREIFLNLGIHKSKLYIKDNHNRYIQT